MSSAKILIVDDEPDILEFLKYSLDKEGYEVYTASDGLEGIQKANSIVPDLVVLDIMMPEMDGVEVCRRLRIDPKFNNTIITFLTARQEDYSQIAALEQGGDDYIAKPIKPRLLVARIRALLRRQHNGNQESSNTLELDGLTIDFDGMTVERDGETINLPRKEFELLKLLSSKPGKVFSRDVIYRKIWGQDVIVGNRTIDVHVRKLREKVGDSHIRTVKGIGYKFEY